MNESDFPQFTDPRVREVMAAAANLVEQARESVELMTEENRYPMMRSSLREKYKEAAEALFAAQHSKPTSDVAIRIITDERMPEGKFALVPPEDEWRYTLHGFRHKSDSEPSSPNPCGGDHGNSYECHACVAGREV